MPKTPEFEEPLKNIDLEASMMGIRMALSDEEHDEARSEFITKFKTSQLAIPTGNAVKMTPDGQIAQGSDIQLILKEIEDEGVAIRCFTSLTNLRTILPELQNGLVLPAWQIAGMVASSPHTLVVEGPDVEIVLSKEELQEIATEIQQQIQESQQRAVARNEGLEAALSKLALTANDESRRDVETAFLQGFCRLPVLIEADGKQPHCVLTANNGPDGAPQSIPLRVQDGGLLCFTSEAALSKWDEGERPVMLLPGAAIVEMSAKSGLNQIQVDPGSPNGRALGIVDGKLKVE